MSVALERVIDRRPHLVERRLVPLVVVDPEERPVVDRRRVERQQHDLRRRRRQHQRAMPDRRHHRRLHLVRRREVRRAHFDVQPRRRRGLGVIDDRILRDQVVRQHDEVAGPRPQLGGAPRDLRDAPSCSPTLTQCPTWNGRSLWIARPAKALPSVSCSAKPMTTALTADVVTSCWLRNVEASRISAMTMKSCRMIGKRSGTRSTRSGLTGGRRSR